MLEILLTQMRREGFEMTVSPPKVLIRKNGGIIGGTTKPSEAHKRMLKNTEACGLLFIVVRIF